MIDYAKLKAKQMQRPPMNYISDKVLWSKWYKIRKHLINKHVFATDRNGMLHINSKETVYVAKHSVKFRTKSYLDWAWYSPQDLAYAIDKDCIQLYYEYQLTHKNSDPNFWKDTTYKKDLKQFYADRMSRVLETWET